MAQNKKTIKREDLVRRLNVVITESFITNIEKLAICDFVEGVLLNTGTYQGYTIGALERGKDESFLEFRLREVSTRKYL